MAAFFALILLAFLYFIPAFVAKGKRNAGAIFLLNLLAGWTVIGWVAALIWAVTNDAQPSTVIIQQPAPAQPTHPAMMATRTSLPLPSVPALAPTPAPMARAIATVPESRPAAASVSEELERLFQLKEKGAITEAEYSVHKAKLLA